MFQNRDPIPSKPLSSRSNLDWRSADWDREPALRRRSGERGPAPTDDR
jgi:hypothetical protein